jgi:hypothetical protein
MMSTSIFAERKLATLLYFEIHDIPEAARSAGREFGTIRPVAS